MSYTVGVLGGMGTLATCVFFNKLFEKTPDVVADQDHINTIILNHASLPDRTDIILNHKENAHVFLDQVAQDFKIFDQAGVQYIAITCNTSHYFIREMRAFTKAEIIDMPREALLQAKKLGYSSTVIFGTPGCIKGNVYGRYQDELGIRVLYPSQEDQDLLRAIIYDIKTTGRRSYKEFDELKERYKEKGCIIVGCTELSLLDTNNTLDAMDVLVTSVLRRCGRCD